MITIALTNTSINFSTITVIITNVINIIHKKLNNDNQDYFVVFVEPGKKSK